MKRIITVGAAVIALAASGVAFSDDGNGKFSEVLSGLKEAPQIVLTTGTGTFEATISKDGSEIAYVLTFENLKSDARQAHIHLGWPQSNGNIVLWLCDSDGPGLPASPVASTPLCSQNSAPGDIKSGRVEGTLTAADLVAVPANGIAGSADFGNVVAAIRSGLTYVNVHTANIGAGEIRSQLSRGDEQGHQH
jgi:CHRD domain-containing protein